MWRQLREDLVLGNGHLLYQVLRKSGILPRTVHKEPGTTLRNRCCWNSQKADILSSVQRLHCPGVSSKAKGEESFLYTSLQIKTQLIQFIALFFLSISSVSTGQWQQYAKNLRTIKIERGNLWYWWDNQMFLVKSKQKLLSTIKILGMTKLVGSNTFSKMSRFHQKTDWVNFVRKQDLCVLLKLDNISWPRILVILNNFNQWLVVNTLFHETTKLLNQKGGSKEIWELDLYWKSWPVFSTSSTELKFELNPWIKTILNPGQNFLWNGQICDRFYWRQYRKSCKSSRRANSTNKRECGCSQVKGKSKTSTERTCWDDSNHTIPIHQRRWIDIEPSKQDLDSYDLSKKVINLLRHNQTLQREEDGAIELYKSNSIFEIIIHKYNFGLMIVGKLVWRRRRFEKKISVLPW